MERRSSSGRLDSTEKKNSKCRPSLDRPVSAYALFFRDTQAAIKGQNPNASFGEVSKIVASMWDSLDVEHKNVYKKKTEAAKKEYLKALAAYRASLVSKNHHVIVFHHQAAADQSDSLYGNSVSSTTVTSSPPGHPHSLSPLQKKSPLLTSLMEGTAPPPGTTLQSMTQPQQPMLNSQVWGMHPMNTTNSMVHQQQSGQMGQMIHTTAGHQMNHPLVHMGNGQPMNQLPQCQSQDPPPQPGQGQSVNNSPGGYTQNISVTGGMSPMGMGSSQGGLATQGMMSQGMPQTCLRNGCTNPAVDSPDWDREYCSSECVVSHCRDVFSAWVASRQANNSFASVK